MSERLHPHDDAHGYAPDEHSGSASDPDSADFHLDDETLRAAGTAKWSVPARGVLPAWVAEMDVRGCPAVLDAVASALRAGTTGYPDLSRANGLAVATADYLREEFDWVVDPEHVLATGDVMAGVRLILETCCEPAPVVVPVPTYPPFLAVVPVTGREVVRVPMIGTGADAGGRRRALDLDAIDSALAAGARTVLLASPHNPTGRAFTRVELTALLDVVRRHGARVISDEIHAPLALPPARHVPLASLPGAAEAVVTLTATSKAWNVAGLKCAQIVTSNGADRARLRGVPHVANAGVSPLGIVAAVAAYRRGRPWLESLRGQLADRVSQLEAGLAATLPDLRWVPPEATYLAWVDASAYATAADWDASTAALRGGVMLSRGVDFAAAPTWVRINVATSAERLDRIIARLADAWAGRSPHAGG